MLSLQAMQKLGMGHVLDKYLQGLTQGGTDQHGLNEFQYEAAWRNMKWDLAMPTRLESVSKPDIHSSDNFV